MENQIETKKDNKILLGIILGIVIGGLIFGSGTYYLTNINFNQKESKNENTSKEENDADTAKEVKYSHSIDKKKNKQVLLKVADDMNIVVDEKGQVYARLNDSFYENGHDNTIDQEKKSIYDNFMKDAKHSGLILMDDIYPLVKLDIDKVMYATEVLLCQLNDTCGPGSRMVLFIKEDGTVTGFSPDLITSDGKLNIINNWKNLKNIISIVKSNDGGFIAIDVNGDEY